MPMTAEKLNMAFYETSAKDKTMVDDAFFALTRDIKKRLGESSGGPSTTRTTGPITVHFHQICTILFAF